MESKTYLKLTIGFKINYIQCLKITLTHLITLVCGQDSGLSCNTSQTLLNHAQDSVCTELILITDKCICISKKLCMRKENSGEVVRGEGERDYLCNACFGNSTHTK